MLLIINLHPQIRNSKLNTRKNPFTIFSLNGPTALNVPVTADSNNDTADKISSYPSIFSCPILSLFSANHVCNYSEPR